MNDTLGLALLCDTQGTIIDILHNSPELEIEVQKGKLFTRLVASGSLASSGLSLYLAFVRCPLTPIGVMPWAFSAVPP